MLSFLNGLYSEQRFLSYIVLKLSVNFECLSRTNIDFLQLGEMLVNLHKAVVYANTQIIEFIRIRFLLLELCPELFEVFGSRYHVLLKQSHFVVKKDERQKTLVFLLALFYVKLLFYNLFEPINYKFLVEVRITHLCPH